MQTLSLRLSLIRRIGHKIKIWSEKCYGYRDLFWGLLHPLPLSLPPSSPLVVSAMARTHSGCGRGRSAHAPPEYWFSTDAYITIADKRHLHFDGLRRVHLTFRMHFARRALPCEKLNLTYIYHPILHIYAYSRLYLSRHTLWKYVFTINSPPPWIAHNMSAADDTHLVTYIYTYAIENLNRKILDKLPEIKTRKNERVVKLKNILYACMIYHQCGGMMN